MMQLMQKTLRGLLVLMYILLCLFGFLTGMFSEPLIGSVHPMAGVLADAMAWLGAAISLFSAAGLAAMLGMKQQPRLRLIVMAMPFLLLGVQLALSYVAETL